MTDDQAPAADPTSFFSKWRGYPGKLMATSVGVVYTTAVFAKMPKTKKPREKIFWYAFGAGTAVNVLICNLLFALIEDEMKVTEDKLIDPTQPPEK